MISQPHAQAGSEARLKKKPPKHDDWSDDGCLAWSRPPYRGWYDSSRIGPGNRKIGCGMRECTQVLKGMEHVLALE